MKKIIAALLLTIAMVMPSEAQVKFGLKGGLNLTKMSVSNIDETFSNKSGFFIGPTIKFSLPIVGLGMDAAVVYDQREGKLDNADETLKQQSIQIPIHARWSFGLGSTANFFIFAGPQFGFNVGDGEKKYKVSDWSLKTANISGDVGLGITLLSHLQLTGSYNFALSKSAEVTVNGKTGKVKNNAWQIALAYYF